MDYSLKDYVIPVVSTVIVTMGLFYSPNFFYSSRRVSPREVRHPVGVVVSNPLEKETVESIATRLAAELEKPLQRFKKTGEEVREDLEKSLKQSKRKEN